MQTLMLPMKGGTYQYFDRGVSRQYFENFYLEHIESVAGKVESVARPCAGYVDIDYSLVPTSGYVAGTGLRCLYKSTTGPAGQPRIYAVVYDTLFRILPNGTAVTVGNIQSGTTKVSIADNGFDLLLVDGWGAYTCSLAANDGAVALSFAPVLVPSINAVTIVPDSVVYLNQRFIINTGKNVFYYSDLASTTFAQDNFYSAESSADPVLALGVVQNRVYVIGSTSYEVWVMDGTGSDPMSAISGTASQIGTMSPDSVATIADRIFWLGSSGAGKFMVFVGSGLGDPKRISDNAMEEQLKALSHVSTAIGQCYIDRGHMFYLLSFPADKKTFVFDSDTGAWHMRSSYDANTSREKCYEPMYFCDGYNDETLAGGITTNKVYSLSEQYATYDGDPIVRRLITPVVWSELNPIQLKEIMVDITLGTTQYLNGEENSTPTLNGKFSGDGGNTWGTQVGRSIGRTGQYSVTPPKWVNSITGRGVVAWFECSNDLPFTIRQIRCVLSPCLRR